VGNPQPRGYVAADAEFRARNPISFIRHAIAELAISVPRSRTKARFRGGSRELPVRSSSAVASAVAGSNKGALRQPEPPALDPRRREFGERLRRARLRGGARCLLEGFPLQPDAGAFRGGSRKLPVRGVSAVASAMAGSNKGALRQPELARAHALDPRQRKFCEPSGWHACAAAGAPPMVD